MRFQTPLVPARLIRRYKRFLADCRLEDGREITAHVANPGSMLGLADPDSRIWLEPNDDPKKKLKFGWRLVEHDDGTCTCVDTGAANRVIGAALRDHAIAELSGYDAVLPEQRYGEKSRVDFLLRHNDRLPTYVEVKSVTLSRQPGLAEFPDSVTARGARHLHDLAEMAQQGHRAVMLFAVMRGDAQRVALAGDIDPAYQSAFDAATARGVQVIALQCHPTPQGITLGKALPLGN